MRNVLAVALDRIDEAAEKYQRSKTLQDLHKFILLDADLTELVVKMGFNQLISCEDGWNYSVYAGYVAYSLGYLDKHRNDCQCIHCNVERDMPKFLKWRNKMRNM